MDTTNTKKTVYGFWLDLFFISRLLKQWKLVILCISIIVGVTGYIGADFILSDTYTASAVVSVVSKENAKAQMSAINMNNALKRSTSMWNSSSLLKLIKDENPNVSVDGALHATTVSNTNLISITSTSNTAEKAYAILKSAVRYYHQIEPNFDTSYYNVVLTSVTESSISVTHKKPWIFGLAGFVASTFGCIFLLCLWSVLTDVIHEENQAKDLLAVPVYESLAFVNKIKKGIKAILITQRDCDLDYLEGIDRLTARVEQHLHNRNNKTIMISSVNENEGKSTVAVNLALNLSRRGGKTLLLDMDFCRPVLYKIFDHEKSDKNGLSEVLTGKENLSNLIETIGENLDIIWQYKPVQDSDRMLENLPFNEKLSEFEKYYDYIVIDTPPVAPVRDTEVMAHTVKETLLVVRQDFIRASVVNDVIDQLEENGTLCMGVVLNSCKNNRKLGSRIPEVKKKVKNDRRRKSSDAV